jgi:isopenicillin N synthase-like dioxygenase
MLSNIILFLIFNCVLLSSSDGINLPIIDLSPFIIDHNPVTSTRYSKTYKSIRETDDSIKNCSKHISSALKEYGMFIAIGYNSNPIEEELEALNSAKSLFKMTDDERIELKMNTNDNGGVYRGYLPFGSESGVMSNFEPKEGFSYGNPIKRRYRKTSLEAINIWPSSLDKYSIDKIENVFLQHVKISHTVVEAVSLIDNINLESIIRGGSDISLMRMFHYFPANISESQRTLGSSEHTDWGFITVILQDEIGGLQFFHRNSWHDVQYIPGWKLI